MKTVITVIVDNIGADGLDGEWGLCLLVEVGDKKMLVDAGSSNLFCSNLEKLKFDISNIDYGVLSHAHYDHANGITDFFNANSKANFYIRKTAGDNCYFKKYFFHKYIGIPKKLMSKYADRIKVVDGDYMLFDRVYLIPHKTSGLEALGKREMMYVKTAKGYMPDNFSHEQSIVVDTDRGLVIISSCSHGGAVNIINEVIETFPHKHVYAFVGGLHLFNKSDDEVREVARAIKETGIELIYTGHCTKNRAYNIMREELGSIVEQFKVGRSIEF